MVLYTLISYNSCCSYRYRYAYSRSDVPGLGYGHRSVFRVNPSPLVMSPAPLLLVFQHEREGRGVNCRRFLAAYVTRGFGVGVCVVNVHSCLQYLPALLVLGFCFCASCDHATKVYGLKLLVPLQNTAHNRTTPPAARAFSLTPLMYCTAFSRCTGVQRLSISDVPRNSAKERRFAERSCGQIHGGVWSSTSTVSVVHTRCATRAAAAFSTSLRNERGGSLHWDKTQGCATGQRVLNGVFLWLLGSGCLGGAWKCVELACFFSDERLPSFLELNRDWSSRLLLETSFVVSFKRTGIYVCRFRTRPDIECQNNILPSNSQNRASSSSSSTYYLGKCSRHSLTHPHTTRVRSIACDMILSSC